MGVTENSMIFQSFSPELMALLGDDAIDWLSASGVGIELHRFYDSLPDIEAEILFLLIEKGKTQKDVAELLKISQPSVSYRFRRAVVKIKYLAVFLLVDLNKFIETVPKLKDKEREILKSYCLALNQELVADLYKIRQSTVRWILSKTMAYVKKEFDRNERLWLKSYVTILFIMKNVRIRIKINEK